MDLIRSWMFVPGHRQRMIDKAFGLKTDAIMLDIEDGVAPNEKDTARKNIAESLGRDLGVAGGRFGPFAAVDYTWLHGERFGEQGDTGFELVGAPWNQARLSGAAGARYSRTWDPAGRWLRLDLEANWRQVLADAGAPQRAAFSGMPGAWFDIPVPGYRNGYAELRLGLAGMLGRRWDWSMGYTRSGGGGADEAVQVALQRGF